MEKPMDQNKVIKQGKVVELVIWKAKKDFTEGEVLERAKAVNKFIASRPGFLYRDLAKNENGEWLDFLYWDSMENAEVAAKAAQGSRLCHPFFETIDMEAMKFYHFNSKFKYVK